MKKIDLLIEVMKNLTSVIANAKTVKSSPNVYNNEGAMKFLNVGDKLLRKYRNDGLLSYSRVDDKYWYTEKDLQEFLTKTHCEAFA